MHSEKISIIVPVYQLEEYLEKCINSIIAQTYTNLEIILVDDGSTDNCPAICDRFQAEDPHIKVIHQENGGLSHARNVGMEMATGDYIGFVDSDDWIEPNMYEVLMSALLETGADIAVCDRQIETSTSKPISNDVTSCKIKLYSSEEALRTIIKGGGVIRNTVWNKLYKRNVLSNIHYSEGKICEDILWTPQSIGNAKLLVYVDCKLYHYFQRTTSLAHNDQITLKRGLDRIEMHRQLVDYIKDYYPALKKLSLIKYQNSFYREYVNISLNHNQLDADGKISRELYRQFCLSSPFNIFDYDIFSSTLARTLFRFSPSLFLKIYIIYKKLRDFSKRTTRKQSHMVE